MSAGMMTCARACLTAALVGWAVPAAAQTAPADPATSARLRLGPFWLNPQLAVKNVGVDTNVFNDAADPKQDFNAVISPSTDIYVRAGMLRADLRIVNELVYYRRYATERSSNTVYSGTFTVALTRLAPYFGFDYTSTKERPGFEIDKRARQTITKARTGATLPIGARTSVALDLSRTQAAFDSEADFRGIRLSDQLNRTESIGRLSLKRSLTPLTRAVVAFEVQSDRFEEIRTRNSDSYRVTAGVEFEPVALISGGATFGYRSLRFLGGALEGSSGFVTGVNVTYTLATGTKLNISGVRDVSYSYDPAHPFYLLNGIGAKVTQRIFGPFDVQLIGGRQRLDYRDERGVRSQTAETDRVTQYGGGIGYNFGRAARFGITFTSSRRQSPDPQRRYNGNQIGTSVTYGT